MGETRDATYARLQALLRRLKAAPRDADAAWDAADIAIDHGFEDEAVVPVEASVRLIASHPQLWQMLGLVYRGLDKSEAALACFDRAARLAPQDARIQHAVAITSMEAGRPAVALYDRALTLAPLDGELLLGRAAALAATGAVDTAEADLGALLHQHPGWIAGHLGFARLRSMSGRAAAATETLDAAIARNPADVTLHTARFAILMRTVSPVDRLAAVADARQKAGPHPDFAKAEAIAHSEAGDIAAADALFATIDARDDCDFALARVRHELRAQRPETVDRLAEALASSTEAVTAWAYRATAWRMLGDARLGWLENDAMVGVYDIADQLPPLEALADVLRHIHVGRAQPLDQSVRGGTQTDGPLFARAEPEIRAVREAVLEKVQRYQQSLPPIDPRHPLLSAPRKERPRFAGSWSVRLQGHGHHVNHVHTQGWLSSALYVALPDGDSGQDRGMLQLGAPPEELGLGLPPTRTIEPRPGRLVLFPSTTWHGTTRFTAGERLTIAFDVARPRS